MRVVRGGGWRLVANLPLVSAGDEAGYVHHMQEGRDGAGRPPELTQPVVARVRHCYTT